MRVRKGRGFGIGSREQKGALMIGKGFRLHVNMTLEGGASPGVVESMMKNYGENSSSFGIEENFSEAFKQ